MAGVRNFYGNSPDAPISIFCVDTVEEVKCLPTTKVKGTGLLSHMDYTANQGSICEVGNESGTLLVYKLFSFGWKEL